MKLDDILTEGNMYTAYVLDDASRDALMKKFPPKYDKVVGHHITVEFGVPEGTEPPADAKLNVLGRVDSGDGLEALVVAVDGDRTRPDGKTYHVTWSLDPDKYKPVDSNDLIARKQFTLSQPISITTKPTVLK